MANRGRSRSTDPAHHLNGFAQGHGKDRSRPSWVALCGAFFVAAMVAKADIEEINFLGELSSSPRCCMASLGFYLGTNIPSMSSSRTFFQHRLRFRRR